MGFLLYLSFLLNYLLVLIVLLILIVEVESLRVLIVASSPLSKPVLWNT